eukprot:403334225
MESRSTLRQAGQNIVSQPNTGKFIQQKLSKEYSQIQGIQDLSLSKDGSSYVSRKSNITDPSSKDGSRLLDLLGQNVSKMVQIEIQKQKQVQQELKAVKEERKQKTLSIYASGNTTKTSTTSKVSTALQNKPGTKIQNKLPITQAKGLANKKKGIEPEVLLPLNFLNDEIYDSEAHKKEATISITKLYGYTGVTLNINKNTNKLDTVQEEIQKQDSDEDFDDFKTEMPQVNKINQNQQKYVTSYQNNTASQQQKEQTTDSQKTIKSRGVQLDEIMFLNQLNSGKMISSYIIKRTKQIVVGSLISKFLPHVKLKNEELLSKAVSKQTINFVTNREIATYDCRNEDDLVEFISNNVPEYSNIVNLQLLAKGGEAIVYRGKTDKDKDLVVKCTIFDSQCSTQDDIHEAFLHILEESQLIMLLNQLVYHKQNPNDDHEYREYQQFFPEILAEIISINEQTKMIKQYVVIIQNAKCTLNDVLNIWQDKTLCVKNNERYHPLKLVCFFISTLEIIKFLHSINIYYGDMKPQNLLVFEEYSIKIGDFGISIMLDPNSKVTDKIHTLKGLTTAYCSLNTLNAFKQRKKFTMQELQKLDIESLILTFEKCIRSVRDIHQDLYPDIPLEILESFVTDLRSGLSLQLIIKNQIAKKNKNHKLLREFLFILRGENNSNKRFDFKILNQKTDDSIDILNNYNLDILDMIDNYRTTLLNFITTNNKGNDQYNEEAKAMQNGLQQVKIVPGNTYEQYKKDYLLVLIQICFKTMFYDHYTKQYKNKILDNYEQLVQEPSLAYDPQANIQILNILSQELEKLDDPIDENQLNRLSSIIDKVEKINQIYYNSQEFQDNDFVRTFKGYLRFNHQYELLKLQREVQRLFLQQDYNNTLPIAYDLYKKSQGSSKDYAEKSCSILFDCLLNLELDHYKKISIMYCLGQIQSQTWEHESELKVRWNLFEKFQERKQFEIIFRNLDAIRGIKFDDSKRSMDKQPILLQKQMKFILFKYFTHFDSDKIIIEFDEYENKILLSILSGKMFDINYRFNFENFILMHSRLQSRNCIALLSVLNTDENMDLSLFKTIETNSYSDFDNYWKVKLRDIIFRAALKRKNLLISQGIQITEKELDLAMTWRYYIKQKIESQN